MIFAKTGEASHNELDVLTFEPRSHSSLVERLHHFIKASNSPEERLFDNYKDIDFNDFVAISLLLKNDDIKGFSTVWHRSFYPQDTVRIFNRWWEDGSIRKNTNTVISAHSIAVLNHQLYYAKKNDFKWAFMSRERNELVMKRMSSEINESTDFNFHFHNEKIPVCYPKAESCWQWVVYSKISGDKSNWSMLDGKDAEKI